MADVETVLSAFPRIHYACRQRQVRDPADGRALSAHQANILAHLDPVDPTMVTELAEHLGVTPSTMSLTLKRLSATGWVRRDRDPADRRVTNVRLTEAGARVRDAQTVLDAARVDGMLSLMNPGDRRDALRGLGLLAEAADTLMRRGRKVMAAQTGAEP